MNQPPSRLDSPSGPFRVYELKECGPDGYPLAWHRLDHDTLMDWSSGIGESHYPPGAVMGVKHLVRAEAGHRCIRCLHPYGRPAKGEWTPCDERCTHRGPYRYRHGPQDEWYDQPEGDEPWVGEASLGSMVGVEIEARWRILTVHHLQHGHDAKRDLRWWNLAALCQRCHLTIQGRVQMERVWPWPHTDWFRPYAAGWYAWSYLGEDLERHEVMARMDELLALELIA